MMGWLMLFPVGFYLAYILFDIHSLIKQIHFIKKQNTNQEVRLKSSNPLIKRLAIEINNFLVEKKQLKGELIESRRQLDQAINNISHDLRTPLTVATGYTQYLQQQAVAESERQALLGKIHGNLLTVEEHLELLLDYNRLNEKRFVIELKKVNLSKLLEECLLDMYFAFQDKKFDLQPQIQSSLEVMADPSVTTRIIQNLLGNMLQHGKGKGEISLQQKQDEMIELVMKNELETPLQAPEKLTERFYTEDLARKNQHSGLGLYIVKELVAEQQAELTIQTTEQFFCLTILFQQAKST